MIDRIVVINDLSFAMGGASLLAVRSAREFIKRGIEVTFISGDEPCDEGIGVEHVGLGQSRLLAGRAASNALRGIYNAAAERMIADWIRRNDTPRTIYHLHGWSQILSPSVFAGLSAVQDRLVLTAHDFFISCPNGAAFDYREERACTRKPMGMSCITARCDRRNYLHKLWRVARQGMQNSLLANAPSPQLLLIHEGMGAYLGDCPIPPSEQVTVPNPITPFTPEKVQAEENDAVLFVGRMEPTKGIDLAARACRAAGLHLVALGDGSLLEDLRREYPDFEFPGRIESEEIGPYAQRARMLVMPSLHMEPFGLTAVEALWSGLPVILSDLSLIADDIVDAQAGRKVNPRDTASFATVLKELAANDALVRQMSEAAFHKTGALAMTMDGWIDALLETYRTRLAVHEVEDTYPAHRHGKTKIENLERIPEALKCESM